MKTIIKPGKTEFTTICSKCDCEFKYELSDVEYWYVTCPECGERLEHNKEINNEQMNFPSQYLPYTIPCKDLSINFPEITCVNDTSM